MAMGWHILMTASNSWHKAQFMGCPHRGAHSGLNQAIRDYRGGKHTQTHPDVGYRWRGSDPRCPTCLYLPEQPLGDPVAHGWPQHTISP